MGSSVALVQEVQGNSLGVATHDCFAGRKLFQVGANLNANVDVNALANQIGGLLDTGGAAQDCGSFVQNAVNAISSKFPTWYVLVGLQSSVLIQVIMNDSVRGIGALTEYLARHSKCWAREVTQPRYWNACAVLSACNPESMSSST